MRQFNPTRLPFHGIIGVNNNIVSLFEKNGITSVSLKRNYRLNWFFIKWKLLFSGGWRKKKNLTMIWMWWFIVILFKSWNQIIWYDLTMIYDNKAFVYKMFVISHSHSYLLKFDTTFSNLHNPDFLVVVVRDTQELILKQTQFKKDDINA
jgi:hypothetical protein